MVRNGEVVEIKGDQLTIVFERPAACTNCNGCLSKQCTNVEIQGQAEVGDTVDVALPDKSVVGASAIAYLIPLVLLIVGLILGQVLYGPLGISFNKDLFTAVCGGVLLGMGLLVVYGVDKSLRNKQDWQPRIVAVHPHQEKLPEA